MRVMVTGASGFIGRELLKSHKFEFLKVLRDEPSKDGCFIINKLDQYTNWSGGVDHVDVVVHLAALAHNKQASSAEYYSVNYDGTIHLATEAAKAGVKRFIFLSTIGVNGVSNNVCFKYSDKERPADCYAASKFKAEQGLKKIAEEKGMELVIIRPPLVYGKNAPGNFGNLLRIARKNLPLPLGAINNKRSFIAIDNLIHLIVTCIEHPNADNQTFLVSDDEYISTSKFLKKLTIAAGKNPCLLPIPVSFLKLLASMVGKKATIERLSSSLTVNIQHTKNTLNWKPPLTLDEGINRCFK